MHVTRHPPHDTIYDHRMGVDQAFELVPFQAQYFGSAHCVERCTDLRSGATNKRDHTCQITGLKHVDDGFSIFTFDLYLNIAMRKNISIIWMRISRLDDDLARFI